ncbi:uncharacterized protein DUF4060 [Serratia fonticola]|jgi:hypothetical protein|uniref:Uncharacterized protein DUF4060 n=1 Tax=Serratia fonticola TaxID=47917 RepID=A0A542BN17_SERFO|nr:DUF4060 family protein [Serratia fonticola]TQI79986.1 uncharacterized protein DUF4060 [Serratia fonticola]TQI97988.1 uncharacterized protein DUF4060 [Serratia fonticola]TVZ72483.1 uncharacterized protein DUF4060 [Serratia fonticola]
MKEIIRGDTEPVHVFVANLAIEKHKRLNGEGNKYHPIIYPVKYRGKNYQIEVVNRANTIAATVITGVRNLTKLHYDVSDKD